MIGSTPRRAHVDGSFVPAPTPGVVAVDSDGEAVLVDEGTGRLHLVNASGALLWACFDGESSIADICFDLADQLGVPFEQVLTDTLVVTGDLLAEGLIRDGRDPHPDPPDEAQTLDDQTLDVPRRHRLLEEPPAG